MPKITSASMPSRSMSLILNSGVVQRRTPRFASSKRPVSAILSTRWFCPGMCFWPEGPTPHTSPKEKPPLEVQCGPSGLSATCGMRSLSAGVALDVKRSSGSQGRSMWLSAEMRLYCIEESPPELRITNSRGDRHAFLLATVRDVADRHPRQVAHVAQVVVLGAAVHRAAVVPHDELVRAPAVRVDELALRHVGDHLVDQLPAVLVAHAVDASRVRGDIERLAAGLRDRAHHHLRHRRQTLPLAFAELGETVTQA